MATYKRFEDLEVWQASRELCSLLNGLIGDDWFKKNKSIKDQIQGSSGSIMDNIAEGFERGSTREFVQFLGYSKGACGEFRSQLYRALDSGLISQEQFENLSSKGESIAKQLQGFMSYLNKQHYKGNRFLEPEVEYGNFSISIEE
jgi:four helix bundle protein